MHVSLAEALEVRGGPLHEEEIWAVLNQSAESLQELFRKADPTALSFIISPWSLLLLPSGSVSFTDENVSNQDLRAFTAPEVLQNQSLSSLSDIEKIHIYSLGMTLYWGADYDVPENQPIRLGDHLNSILLGMCEDIFYARVSVRTVLDACSAHIRNSNCAPSFSYVKQLVRLVLGSLSGVDQLACTGDRKQQTERSQAIRERLRGKGLPTGRSLMTDAPEVNQAEFCQQTVLNKRLSKSMGVLSVRGSRGEEEFFQGLYSEYNSGREDATDTCCPYRCRATDLERKGNGGTGVDPKRKIWASSSDLLSSADKMFKKDHIGDSHRHNHAATVSVRTSTAARSKEGRYSDGSIALDVFGPQKLDHMRLVPESPTSAALSSAFDRIKERQKKLQLLREAMNVEEHVRRYKSYYSDIYSTDSECPSFISTEADFRQARRIEALRDDSSGPLSGADDDTPSGRIQGQRASSHQYEASLEGNVVSQDVMLKRQEEEMMQLQAKIALRQSRLSLYPGDAVRSTVLDMTVDPLREIALETAMTQRKLRNFFGPEFVKTTIEPFTSLDLPKSILNKKGKNEDIRRKVNVMLLSGQRLELTCDTKIVCKDVFDMVVAHIGLVEHHLFGLATLKDNEFLFVDPELKLTKVAPEGWKEEPKKKGKNVIHFTLFFRIKFFVDDISLIQHTLTCHQYYLQLRKDLLEEKMHCDDETALLLASLALQAEYGDYQAEVHGLSYFRLEHYLPARVIENLDLSNMKEELPKLHSSYVGASEKEAELEFLKICQRLTEYGVHFHRVLPEKKSQTGILLGVCPKGVLIFEVHNGIRTPVLRFPWRETKKISFSKRKITLQNTSDGIKHAFQTDTSKTCQYLLQLCSSQHKFQLQMRARQSNQDAQEIERASFRSLNLHAESVKGFNVGRAISTGSLASSTLNRLAVRPLSVQAEILKRLSYSELSLFQPAQGSSRDKNEKSSWEERPRVMSKSFHDLTQNQVSVSPLRKNIIAPADASSRRMEEFIGKIFQQVPKSETDSVTGGAKLNNSHSHAGLNASLERRKNESDSSSAEDTGQPYVVDVLPKKPNTVMSVPEREINLVNLKKDEKYGLGFQITGGEKAGKLDLGIFILSVTPGGPADLQGSLKPGDRLISVNSVSLEGIGHHMALEIIESAPEDVTLVISQPKEKLTKGSSNILSGTKGYLKTPTLKQDNEAESSSEEHNRSLGRQKPPSGTTSGSCSGIRDGSLSSQDSRTESASLSQTNGIFGNHISERVQQELQHCNDALSKCSDKNRASLEMNPAKAKRPGVVETADFSDRGDSDMDEATYSGSQEQTSAKKEASFMNLAIAMNSKKLSTPPLKPGDIFEVKLAKNDNGLGISVTVLFDKGGVNTTVRHGGLYVKAVIPKGAAEADGRIQKGDRVLSVNGISLEGATHKQAVEILRNTGQEVHLVLEKGQLPAAKTHAPVTPQCTPPHQPVPCAASDTPPKKMAVARDYSFVTAENTFAVKLVKNSSGLGFSFCREDSVSPEQPGSSIVRVKKLFPGQPAAESGQIEVGDVILKVNGVSLKGLSQQEVISALRGTSFEVTLLLCRPLPGILPEIDPSLLTPIHTPPQMFPEISKGNPQLSNGEQDDSSDENEALDKSKKQTKALSRRDSYSDSSGSGGEELVTNVAQIISTRWSSALCQATNKSTAPTHSPYEMPCSQEEAVRAVCYSSREPPGKPQLEGSNPPSPMLDLPPLPNSRTTLSGSTEDNYNSMVSDLAASHRGLASLFTQLEKNTEEYEPEVELHVVLMKSEKGSLGFTVTKGNDSVGCYIHDVVQDPAKSDGRLRPGDRLIKVNDKDVTNMSHTDAVSFLRAAPKTVRLVLGRVLEFPKMPILPHLLHDITITCQKEELGISISGGYDSIYQVIYISDIGPTSAAAMEGSLHSLDIIHYINGISTQGMALKEARRTLEMSLPTVVLKATRDGHPVFPKTKARANTSPSSIRQNGHLYGEPSGKASTGPNDYVSKVNGELNNSYLMKGPGNITGSNETLPNNATSRTSEFSNYTNNADVQDDDSYDEDDHNEVIQYLLDVVDEEAQNLLNLSNATSGNHLAETNGKIAEEKSEDTDCDGSSLPEDFPEPPQLNGCEEHCDDKGMSERLPPQTLGNEDEITWGSEELPIESINQKQPVKDCPLATDEELAALPVIRVLPSSKYTGTPLKSTIRMLKGLLEQGVPLKEIENLQDLKPLDQCLVGQTKENRRKNRYKNILPYDTTRVPLGAEGGYINASFIRMPVGTKEYVYIACQGPLPTTVADFWQMAWEQNCTVIAMMTQEVEGEKVKCQRYWPDVLGKTTMISNRLRLALVRRQQFKGFVVRVMELEDIQTGELRRISHLNFTAWPDHDTPSQPDDLLTFISYMRHVHKSGPIITHCSAGIGRSGTLICIDVVLGLISQDLEFDISDVVRTMRLQRHGMVQTEDQYIFCYQVILYVLKRLLAEEHQRSS